jgi:hypothetical protein
MPRQTPAGAVVTPEENRDQLMKSLRAKVDSLTRDLAKTTDERDEARGHLEFWQARAEESRKTADKNAENGAAWKKLADERGTLIDNLRMDRDHLKIEAAELRGYIRRVQELDPADVQERRGVHERVASGMPWEDAVRMMRR